MKLNDFYDKLYQLCYIIRYSNVPRIKDESVAEHSFLCAALVMQLHEEYVFHPGDALMGMVAHDIPECATNDVSHKIKHEYPQIKAALEEAEMKVAANMPRLVQEGLLIYNGNTIEGRICHLADAMQCYQYARHEISLGNRGYMVEVKINSERRIKELREEIKKYER